ncbi:hypothetical protein [uncultured Senegalimassilia sp.]|uniref:hypothetical protein n=1 Tax=uncultured Senegalimassilia sp. TaxID=1714350 RepID=UPI00258A6AFE|nr:hypothetical protein [uncultured Senegalimassilia sp.]
MEEDMFGKSINRKKLERNGLVAAVKEPCALAQQGSCLSTVVRDAGVERMACYEPLAETAGKMLALV